MPNQIKRQEMRETGVVQRPKVGPAPLATQRAMRDAYDKSARSQAQAGLYQDRTNRRPGDPLPRGSSAGSLAGSLGRARKAVIDRQVEQAVNGTAPATNKPQPVKDKARSLLGRLPR